MCEEPACFGGTDVDGGITGDCLSDCIRRIVLMDLTFDDRVTVLALLLG